MAAEYIMVYHNFLNLPVFFIALSFPNFGLLQTVGDSEGQRSPLDSPWDYKELNTT